MVKIIRYLEPWCTYETYNSALKRVKTPLYRMLSIPSMPQWSWHFSLPLPDPHISSSVLSSTLQSQYHPFQSIPWIVTAPLCSASYNFSIILPADPAWSAAALLCPHDNIDRRCNYPLSSCHLDILIQCWFSTRIVMKHLPSTTGTSRQRKSNVTRAQRYCIIRCIYILQSFYAWVQDCGSLMTFLNHISSRLSDPNYYKAWTYSHEGETNKGGSWNRQTAAWITLLGLT